MWTLSILLLVVTILLSTPMSRYFAWLVEELYKARRLLPWFERRLYSVALLVFNESTAVAPSI